jgi:hypothetical protein
MRCVFMEVGTKFLNIICISNVYAVCFLGLGTEFLNVIQMNKSDVACLLRCRNGIFKY